MSTKHIRNIKKLYSIGESKYDTGGLKVTNVEILYRRWFNNKTILVYPTGMAYFYRSNHELNYLVYTDENGVELSIENCKQITNFLQTLK